MAFSTAAVRRSISGWTNSEFAFLLFLAQLIALIPLSQFLNGLDFQVALMYMLIPMGFTVYSRFTMQEVRRITFWEVAGYGALGFWLTAMVGYFVFANVLEVEFGSTPRTLMWGVIATQVLFVAPSEELAFRYIIPNWLGKRMGPSSSKWTAGFLSAGLFALFHYTAYAGNFSAMLIAFAIGLIWAGAYYKWGIGATIGSHAAYNLLVSGVLTGALLGA